MVVNVHLGFHLAVFLLCLRLGVGMPAFGADCLAEHNKARERHGAPPLQWDASLSASAQAWASKLSSGSNPPGQVHDMSSGAGENIFMTSGEPSCHAAVGAWMDEYLDYKDDGNCANPASMPGYHTLHFTQIVWKSTRKVGVGMAGNWLVARYLPPGNYGGEFGANVQC